MILLTECASWPTSSGMRGACYGPKIRPVKSRDEAITGEKAAGNDSSYKGTTDITVARGGC
jgi:hypothetical protein